MRDGFQVELDDGTQVSVNTDGGDISRQIDLDGANFPLSSQVQEVDISDAERERDAALNEIGPKKQQAEYALQILEQNPDADFAEIKDQLRSALGEEAYAELGIDSFTDADAATQHLETQIAGYQEYIDATLARFRQETQSAIRAVRELYEAQDEAMKTTLRTIKNSGLGRLGLDWIVAELISGQLLPEIGAPFDTGNFDPATGNF